MDVSVCVTVKNEEKTISDLIMALLTQSRKPDEIVIVDGGSSDKTVEIIRYYQKKDKRVKLYVQKVSRASGRNIAVAKSSGEIIAVTDAGCLPKTDWLEKLVSPFRKPQVEVVAGFYDMQVRSDFQKALSLFIGVTPKKYSPQFIPSARSLAFRRLTFEKISGFPELMNDTAEDSLFAINILRQGVKIHRVKGARVEWVIPNTFRGAFKKFFAYAVGDARSKVWVHPVTGIMSHNIKAFLKIVRYLVFITLLVLGFDSILFLFLFTLVFISYLFWSYSKVYGQYSNIKVALIGVIVQLVSDISVMGGFLFGVLLP